MTGSPISISIEAAVARLYFIDCVRWFASGRRGRFGRISSPLGHSPSVRASDRAKSGWTSRQTVSSASTTMATRPFGLRTRPISEVQTFGVFRFPLARVGRRRRNQLRSRQPPQSHHYCARRSGIRHQLWRPLRVPVGAAFQAFAPAQVGKLDSKKPSCLRTILRSHDRILVERPRMQHSG